MLCLPPGATPYFGSDACACSGSGLFFFSRRAILGYSFYFPPSLLERVMRGANKKKLLAIENKNDYDLGVIETYRFPGPG
jgi:hypothetical protein